MSEWIINRMLAYEGRNDCTSPTCRRYIGWDEPGCIGWHCAVCDLPSSQHGHVLCREEHLDE